MPRQGTGTDPTATLLGYCDGNPIMWHDLAPSLIELKGSQALSERVLDVGLRRRLQRQGLSITKEDIARERGLFAQVSGADRDEGERVLGKIRQNQGLGDVRFPQMLWRNAALRRLVQDQVEVPDAVVLKAYTYEHGQRYKARLIVVADIDTAAKVVAEARQATAFIELVAKYSTDSSRVQGGLLPLVSPVDTTWPDGIRAVLATMQVGATSNPVMVDGGYAVLRLEEILPASGVDLASVQEALTRRARLGVERDAMDRLAREIIRSADVIIMHRALSKVWEHQRQEMLGDAR